jgi:CubicO group peptidase (beta-lactamase class C family)
VVAHRGELVLERYFGGAGPDSLTNSMSMSKTLIGMLVGVAIRDRSIESIDASIGDLVPSWRGDRAAITLRDLLQMTAGLRRSAFVWNPWSDLAQMHMGNDLRAVALAVPRIEPPGERFSYNNVNTQVLAAALENATGRRLAHYLSESLWQPLGAGDAQWWLDREGGMPKAYCCIFARPRDWIRVGLLLHHRGRVGEREVVPEAWIDAMLTPSAREPSYGLHVRLGEPGPWWMTEPFVPPDVIILDGKDFQRVYVVPSHDLIVVRVGEAPWPWEWDESFLVNTLVRGLGDGSGSAAVHGGAPR